MYCASDFSAAMPFNLATPTSMSQTLNAARQVSTWPLGSAVLACLSIHRGEARPDFIFVAQKLVSMSVAFRNIWTILIWQVLIFHGIGPCATKGLRHQWHVHFRWDVCGGCLWTWLKFQFEELAENKTHFEIEPARDHEKDISGDQCSAWTYHITHTFGITCLFTWFHLQEVHLQSSAIDLGVYLWIYDLGNGYFEHVVRRNPEGGTGNHTGSLAQSQKHKAANQLCFWYTKLGLEKTWFRCCIGKSWRFHWYLKPLHLLIFPSLDLQSHWSCSVDNWQTFFTVWIETHVASCS